KMAVAAQRIKQAKKSGAAHLQSIDNPDDPFEVARYYGQAFLEDARRLRIKVADEAENIRPATEAIPQIIALIQRILDREHAYVGPDGVVYFDVQSFPRYGQLSGNTLDKLREGSGGRIDAAHQKAKRHPADFMLWKPDPSHLMKWDSPWGAGYPGWHIECSTLAMDALGAETIDIHTGGEDLVFPHHECEIAQSCAATGADSFANYWLHARFLMVDGKKMSKSAGTFHTVRDVLEGRATGRATDPAALRFELLKAHYRKPANFTADGLAASGSNVAKLRGARDKLVGKLGGAAEAHAAAGRVDPARLVELDAVVAFEEAIGDDLNTAAAIAAVFDFLKTDVEALDPAKALAALGHFDGVLGVLEAAPESVARAASAEIAGASGGASGATSGGGGGFDAQAKAAELDRARAAKDYASADAIRAELVEAGYDVKTTPGGTVVAKKLA
ncbi:MAG: DALR domain-containing protein, partial [Planctomycetota bacterium]